MNELVKEVINGREVRKFSNIKIQEAIESALKSLPPGANVAVVGNVEYSGQKTLAGSIAVKLGDNWSIMAGGYKNFEVKDDWGVGGRIIWTP